MKAQRFNLCAPVRAALIGMGVSTVRVVNAVNAALGDLQVAKSESKLGGGTVQAKKHTFSVTETETNKYTGKLTAPLLFDGWHTAIEKANKLASFETVSIPGILAEWVNKFKATEADKATEAAEVAQAPAE